VLTDRAAPVSGNLKVFSTHLGDFATGFFAAPEVIAKHPGAFPQNLTDAPLLLPTRHNALRNRIDRWLESNGIRPKIVGEFEDSALMKMFGAAGAGVFVGPSAFATDISRRYEVVAVGSTEDVREHVYAISLERRLKHPAVLAITLAAKAALAQS
jgi:LysR family transcriptional activator of nhaA